MKLFLQPLGTLKLALVLLFALSLASCGWLGGGGDDEFLEEEGGVDEAIMDAPTLTFAAPKQLPFIPWFLAHQENLFPDYGGVHGVDIQFQPGDYRDIIEQFIAGEADAIAISNIDAVVNFIPRGIEADVILVSSYSHGNDAIIVPDQDDTELKGKTMALMENSVSHYLLDRYLLKQQIDFESVIKEDTTEVDIVDAFNRPEVFGVTTWNPMVQSIRTELKGKVLFNSRAIPKEISHLLVVRRSTLNEYPGFGNALLAIWINIMERMQGNNRGATLEAMAGILNVERDQFEEELDSIILTDTQVKSLSTIRDRSMRKTMRHIRYFMQRHGMTNDTAITSWVSFPGRPPAILHYNAKMLQTFAAGPEI